QNTRCLASNPHRGLGAGKATLCCASPAIPHAATVPSTNPNSMGSTASEVVGATAYRHRVTFAALRIEACKRSSHLHHTQPKYPSARREIISTTSHIRRLLSRETRMRLLRITGGYDTVLRQRKRCIPSLHGHVSR